MIKIYSSQTNNNDLQLLSTTIKERMQFYRDISSTITNKDHKEALQDSSSSEEAYINLIGELRSIDNSINKILSKTNKI